MGKLNLTKNNKKKKPASGIPNWLLTAIIVVVVVAVLLTCVISIVSSTGLTHRLSTAMKSDDYRVSGNMMKYYYISTYSNIAETYSTYWSYLSIGAAESISDHADIVFGGTSENPNTYDTMFFGDFDGTWYDYFMTQTRNSVKSMLIYCEQADELGIALDDADKTNIEAAIDSAILEFKYEQILAGATENISESTCLNAMYGKGMSRSDIRKAMELSTLASKCQTAIYDQIEAGVTEDRISSSYDADSINYDLVDYFYYSFGVTYDSVAEEILPADYDDAMLEERKDEVDAAYKAKVEEAKAAAAALAEKTTLEDFKGYIYNYAANDSYDDFYTENKPADDKLPTADELATIRTNMIASVIGKVVAGKDAVETDVVEKASETDSAVINYTLYDISITSEFAEAAKKIEELLFSTVHGVNSAYNIEKYTYEEDSELSTWAFGADCVAGSRKTISTGDGATGDVTVESKSHTSSVYFMTKPRYKDESNSKDVAYMMFTDEETAEAAIEKLAAMESITTDSFAALATETGAAANTVYEDYVEGLMQSTTFDEWLYDDETVIGSYTASPLSMSDGSYMVAYYAADGEVTWKVTVKNTLINDDYTAYEDNMIAAFDATVVPTEWVIAWIGKSF